MKTNSPNAIRPYNLAKGAVGAKWQAKLYTEEPLLMQIKF